MSVISSVTMRLSTKENMNHVVPSAVYAIYCIRKTIGKKYLIL